MNSHRVRSGYFCFPALSKRHFSPPIGRDPVISVFPPYPDGTSAPLIGRDPVFSVFPPYPDGTSAPLIGRDPGISVFPPYPDGTSAPPIGRDPGISVFPPYPSSPQRPSGIMSPYSEAIRRKASVIGKIPSSEQQLLSCPEKGAHKLAAQANGIGSQTTGIRLRRPE